MIIGVQQKEEGPHAGHAHHSNLQVANIDGAKGFYTDYLGLNVEEFNMGWVARFTASATGANIQLK